VSVGIILLKLRAISMYVVLGRDTHSARRQVSGALCSNGANDGGGDERVLHDDDDDDDDDDV
jgi:hypothetical protein